MKDDFEFMERITHNLEAHKAASKVLGVKRKGQMANALLAFNRNLHDDRVISF